MESEVRRAWSLSKILGVLFGSFVVFELLFLLWVWPDWSALKRGEVPESALIKHYQELREDDPKLPKLRWTPVRKALPQSLKRAFVVAEDSRFYEHGGIDLQAIRDAMAYNLQHGKILLGASTISQQTAKNMFLSLSRNPLRKWHELILTYLLEAFLKKGEILHVYLNVAEFGTGIYGVEAAARAYYGVSAYQLSQTQAIELAATLPSPKKNNPASRTRSFQKRAQRIAMAMRMMDQYVAQQGRVSAQDQQASKRALEDKLEQLRRDLVIEAAAQSQAEQNKAEIKPEAMPSAEELQPASDGARANPSDELAAPQASEVPGALGAPPAAAEEELAPPQKDDL